jgi:hypothetical protein
MLSEMMRGEGTVNEKMLELKMAWKNTYYRGLVIYVAVLVTLIFGFQMYRYFIAVPASEIRCPDTGSVASLIPVIGVLFDD